MNKKAYKNLKKILIFIILQRKYLKIVNFSKKSCEYFILILFIFVIKTFCVILNSVECFEMSKYIFFKIVKEN